MIKIIKYLLVLLERTKKLAISIQKGRLESAAESIDKHVEQHKKTCDMHWRLATKGCERADKILERSVGKQNNIKKDAADKLAFLNSI